MASHDYGLCMRNRLRIDPKLHACLPGFSLEKPIEVNSLPEGYSIFHLPGNRRKVSVSKKLSHRVPVEEPIGERASPSSPVELPAKEGAGSANPMGERTNANCFRKKKRKKATTQERLAQLVDLSMEKGGSPANPAKLLAEEGIDSTKHVRERTNLDRFGKKKKATIYKTSVRHVPGGSSIDEGADLDSSVDESAGPTSPLEMLMGDEVGSVDSPVEEDGIAPGHFSRKRKKSHAPMGPFREKDVAPTDPVEEDDAPTNPVVQPLEGRAGPVGSVDEDVDLASPVEEGVIFDHSREKKKKKCHAPVDLPMEEDVVPFSPREMLVKESVRSTNTEERAAFTGPIEEDVAPTDPVEGGVAGLTEEGGTLNYMREKKRKRKEKKCRAPMGSPIGEDIAPTDLVEEGAASPDHDRRKERKKTARKRSIQSVDLSMEKRGSPASPAELLAEEGIGPTSPMNPPVGERADLDHARRKKKKKKSAH